MSFNTNGTASGAVGALAYYIPSKKITLAVMCSGHFDYTKNLWNVKLYRGKRRAEKSLYEDLYDASPFKGNLFVWHDRRLGFGLSVGGVMTRYGQPYLQVKVWPTEIKINETYSAVYCCCPYCYNEVS